LLKFPDTENAISNQKVVIYQIHLIAFKLIFRCVNFNFLMEIFRLSCAASVPELRQGAVIRHGTIDI